MGPTPTPVPAASDPAWAGFCEPCSRRGGYTEDVGVCAVRAEGCRDKTASGMFAACRSCADVRGVCVWCGVALAAASAPSPEPPLCSGCREETFTKSLGACGRCGAQTASGMFQTCGSCAREAGACMACGGRLATPLCAGCQGRGYTRDAGRCLLCGGFAPSGQFSACEPCARKTGVCMACRGPLGE